jgi:hypothetical protein
MGSERKLLEGVAEDILTIEDYLIVTKNAAAYMETNIEVASTDAHEALSRLRALLETQQVEIEALHQLTADVTDTVNKQKKLLEVSAGEALQRAHYILDRLYRESDARSLTEARNALDAAVAAAVREERERVKAEDNRVYADRCEVKE